MNELIEQIKTKFTVGVISSSFFFEQPTLNIRKEALRDLLIFLKKTPEPAYRALLDLTGVDYLNPVKHTKIIYILQNPSNYQRLILSVDIGREEPLNSITDLWPGANWYERELYDLFGINIIGHPDLKRILMPDNWLGHPLRKDYALTEESVEFKQDVKPKVPSEIISIPNKMIT